LLASNDDPVIQFVHPFIQANAQHPDPTVAAATGRAVA
jgi:hypothetical protein